jgi:D-arabinose 1-dehydrogenase-like Zn-dependent alcohol dehydrogenase
VQKRSLSEVNDVLEELREGKIIGRSVVAPEAVS